jgi:hypothetical protein
MQKRPRNVAVQYTLSSGQIKRKSYFFLVLGMRDALREDYMARGIFGIEPFNEDTEGLGDCRIAKEFIRIYRNNHGSV